MIEDSVKSTVEGVRNEASGQFQAKIYKQLCVLGVTGKQHNLNCLTSADTSLCG